MSCRTDLETEKKTSGRLASARKNKKVKVIILVSKSILLVHATYTESHANLWAERLKQRNFGDQAGGEKKKRGREH